jgi:peptide/nickel transport system ATP-binding protein
MAMERARERAREAAGPKAETGEACLCRAEGVGHAYRGRWAGLSRTVKTILEDVSLSIAPGAVVGLVGESGGGKSTLARLMLGAERPTSGRVLFKGREMPRPFSGEWRTLRAKIQMISQDPYASLDARVSILEQVAEPLVIHGLADKRRSLELARETLAKVSFPAHHALSKPKVLSGGQLQRAVIARAVILGPELLICDEPVSSLDVSVQAQVLALLSELKDKLGMAMLFVSHDLNVISYVSDSFAVMHKGRLVETGSVKDLAAGPAHPYTELLLSCAPGSKRKLLATPPPAKEGERGCAFYGRCHRRKTLCQNQAPPSVDQGSGRRAACHFPLG